jgi:hypothetical protein
LSLKCVKKRKRNFSRAWWYTSVLERLRQTDYEFQGQPGLHRNNLSKKKKKKKGKRKKKNKFYNKEVLVISAT